MDELIERLRYEAGISDRPGQMDRLNALADEFAAALEAVLEDAARYRWLRDREIPEWLDLWHQNPDRIDAAIDAAMEGEK